MIDWARQQQIFFTRSRPYKKNDQATIESKNNHLVRKYGFYYRYDTDDERARAEPAVAVVNDRLNYLTPTKKPTGYGTDRQRLPHQGSTTSGPPAGQTADRERPLPSTAGRAAWLPRQPQPAAIAREIADLQALLLKLAKDKTEQLYLASIPSDLPEVRKGIRIKAS